MVALMKRRSAKQRDAGVQRLVEQLTDQVNNMDDKAIDAMYGLEPVYEPESIAAEHAGPTQFVSISCPYCGESYETQVDLTGGSFTYIEDCQVCCQPIELSVVVGAADELVSVTAQRMD